MPLNLRERINSRISLLCSVVVLVLLVLVMHQMDYTLIHKPQKEAAEAAALKEQQDKIKAETPVISTASVIAVGDNLYHSKLYESGENDSGIWNYDHIYTHVLDQIQAATRKLFLLQTTMLSALILLLPLPRKWEMPLSKQGLM